MQHTNYPEDWPKPTPHRPKLLASRITEQQKLDLFHRNITTRELAKALGVHEAYLSSMFPGKAVPVSRQIAEAMHKKRAIRKSFRQLWARRVLKGEVSVQAAALATNVSERTMRRVIDVVKKAG